MTTKRTRRFEKLAIPYIMELEGILETNHPDDPGGKTVFGISARSNPDLYRGGRIPTRSEAIQRFRENYWAARYDSLAHPYIALELFEAGVLSGPGRAVEAMQTAHNVVHPEGWTDLAVDGGFGPMTLRAVNRLIRRSPASMRALYKAMNGEQYNHFKKVANRSFMIGWVDKRIGGDSLPKVKAGD